MRARNQTQKRTRVGILQVGGKDWIGGANYVTTAFNALTASEQFQPTWLVAKPIGGRLEPSDVAEGASVVEYPQVLVGSWVRKAIHQLGHRAIGLEVATRRENVEVIFPCISSLGRRTSVAWVGWICDFQHLELPEFFSPEELAGRTRGIRRLFDEAPSIVVSSEHAKRIARESFGPVAERLEVLRFPPPIESPELALGALPSELDPEVEFAFLPGQMWVHKNHEVVFRAWAAMGDAAPLLICTGAHKDYRRPDHPQRMIELIRSLNIGAKVKLLEVIPRQTQLALFRRSRCVLNPSLYEGWSTTVEEGLAFGRPLVLADLPIFREQAPQATFFSARDPESLAAAVLATVAKGPSQPERSAAEVRKYLDERTDGYRHTLEGILSGAIRARA